MMKVNPKVRLSKTLGLHHQEVLKRNHAVIRKATDPPTDHKSDQELGKKKGDTSKWRTDITVMGSGDRSDIEYSP